MISLKSVQRHDVRDNVATFQRVKFANVATFQRGNFSNVVTLDINVATFQRHSKSTSRRSRGIQNRSREVGISRRDVPEEGKIDVATLRRRDVESQHRDITEKAQKAQKFNKGLR